MQPSSDGNVRKVFGKMTFSNSYASGGDTFDPIDMGLAQLDMLQINPAVDATPIILIPVCLNTYPVPSTRTSSGSTAPLGRVALFLQDFTQVTATTNESTFSADFVAWGV
ncbi:hypothetical protein EPO05_06125 [Patescibacteria group bacterium]|nr:MAG: hypothetical protein EPO05_06125 [Patescibacteria group bacterium]